MKPLNRFFTISVFLLLALLLSACQPVILSETAAVPVGPVPVPHTPREDAPTYGVRGPYVVGVRDFVIAPTKEGERPMAVSVWYPALNPDNRPEAETYLLDFDNPDFPDFAVAGRALRDAQPDISGGPYPLVVYSHGYWLFRQVSTFLMEQLASWGFVVIAGDHTDNWSGLFGDPQAENYVIRPQEIVRKIDFAATLSDADGAFPGLIDPARVGVIGHSYGADTALLAGGARLNTNVFLGEWCAMHPGDPDDPLNDCAVMPEVLKKMADMAGLEAVPEGLWPDWGDPRVDAVVPLAPGPQYFGPEGLAAVRVPIMLFESELDWGQAEASAYYQPYAQLPADLKTHIVFQRGDHGLYLNECKAMPALIQMGFGWFCLDPVWDMDRAHDLINHFTTAFLLAELKGDAEASAALAPENVAFPGITYETTAYARVTEPTAAIDEVMIEKIEALIETTMRDNQIPGFALGIVKDGQVVYAKGFGLAEYGTDRPVTSQTLFPMASLSKQFTTAAIMQLVEQGQIDLDAPVTEYLPYFKLADEGYQEITIRHLLANLSGLSEPDSEGGEYDFTRRETDEAALEAYVRSLAERELVAPPGKADFLYSNRNFDILGDVIAKVSGQSYEAYVQQYLLTPLGMAKSTFLLAEADPGMLTSSHWFDEAEALVGSSTPPDYAQVNTPSQGLLSNVEDMSRWAMANLNRGELHGQRFLDSASYETMWTPSSEAGLEKWLGFLGGPFQEWGLGWALAEIEGHPLAWWGGVNIGANAMLFLAPDDGVGVVTMVNFADDSSGGTPWYSYDIGYPVLLVMLGIEESSP